MKNRKAFSSQSPFSYYSLLQICFLLLWGLVIFFFYSCSTIKCEGVRRIVFSASLQNGLNLIVLRDIFFFISCGRHIPKFSFSPSMNYIKWAIRSQKSFQTLIKNVRMKAVSLYTCHVPHLLMRGSQYC